MKVHALLASATAVACALTPASSLAYETTKDSKKASSTLEVIEVSGTRLATSQQQQESKTIIEIADVSEWLATIAGGATNKNGGLSGIAQYRGLYGDRIGVQIDGVPVVGAGPNAMDAPLSYASGPAVKSMTVYRGVAPVSVGQNTFAGAIKVKHQKATFKEAKNWVADGLVSTGYQSQGDAFYLAPSVNIAKDNKAVYVYVNQQKSGNIDAANGDEIRPSKYDRTQVGFDFGLQALNTEWHLSYQGADTDASGTAALPMDIDFITSNRLQLSGKTVLGDLGLDWTVGISDAEHGMDNFNLRPNMNANMTRYNTAESTSMFANVEAELVTSIGAITAGFDWLSSDHDSVITSPDNAMFNVVNFNNVTDETASIYAEINREVADGNVMLGARLKSHTSNADEVDHHMAMMNPAIGTLKTNFNNSERKQQDNLLDLALSYTKPFSEDVTWQASAGIKQRAPSYQQRYLWVPMQATGGLADGHTYIGNPELKPETNHQLNFGVEVVASDQQWQLSPQVFYQQIDDYIQALPSMNMQANMVANMMTGKNPMQFSNVDATLYGFDMLGTYVIANNLVLTGQLSVVRGERDDIDDQLYRVAADSLRLTASYQWRSLQLQLVETLVADQDQVSNINDESASSGYATTDILARFQKGQIEIKLGINNLFDAYYEPHLTGRYRPMDPNSSIERGQKIPAAGRNVYLTGSISF